MSVKIDLSENIASYKEDLDRDLSLLETELNSISLSLSTIPKTQIYKIDNLLTECDNNVIVLI
jgi:hypothetical protein